MGKLPQSQRFDEPNQNNAFTQLHRTIKNTGQVQKGYKSFRSQMNLEEDFSEAGSEVDYKLQELNRRNNLIYSE